MAYAELPSYGFSAIQLSFYSSNTRPCTEILEKMDMQSMSIASVFSDLMLGMLKDFRIWWMYVGAMLCSLVPIFPCPLQRDNWVYRLAVPVPAWICFASQQAVWDGC